MASAVIVRHRSWPPIPAFLLAMAVGGCDGIQSALRPAGPQAARIAALWWVMLGVGAAVLAAVVATMLWAVLRPARSRAQGARPDGERWLLLAVGAASGLTVVVLFGLLMVSAVTGRALSISVPDPLTIEVVGHQWWWEVRYPDPDGAVVSANEVHVPVGYPVRLRLGSADVIHSLWVPSLHGKTDQIPGHWNTTWLLADRPGEFRGQCAEFCGIQHAHMALTVSAEPPETFAAWRQAQRAPAPAPTDPSSQRGMEVFLGSSCAGCHTIRGTPALGRLGPDLTHLASRRRIAAGVLPNDSDHLAAWIRDPEQWKPGTRMPASRLGPEDLQALVTYLATLR
jgi:cytochrome c oxidase subunit 2